MNLPLTVTMSVAPEAIPPYWQRFGSFFLYPLTAEGLLTCLGLGVLSGLSQLFFTPADLVLQLVLMVAMLRYGYKVLERTARGYLDDAMIFVESAHGGKYLPYKQFLVIAIGVCIAAYAGQLGGPNLAALWLLVFALLLPANTMLLAVSNDLGESMAPGRLWALVHGIGLPYLGLCACLLLLSMSSGALLRLLGLLIPHALTGVVAGFVGTWFVIVMFRLMGYALYQYHSALGLQVDVGFARQAGDLPPPDPAAQAAGLLREGRHDEAIALARAALAAKPGDFAASQRLHRLLQAVPGQDQAWLEHARIWFPQVLEVGRYPQAIELLEGFWRRQQDYAVPVEQVLPLARACCEGRRYDSAARLLKGFDRRFPGHAEIPAAYVLGARLLIEHGRDEAQARRVLAAVRQHYPDSPAARDAQALGELLDRLGAVGMPGDAPR